MSKRPSKRIKSKSNKPAQTEPIQDEQPDKIVLVPSADSQPPLPSRLEKTPAEIATGGIELFLILIGLIASVVQILSMQSGKIPIIISLIVLFLVIFAWRYSRDLRILLTKEGLQQLSWDLKAKISNPGLLKFFRRPNPVRLLISVILLLSSAIVYYLWTEANRPARFEISLPAPGVSLFIDTYSLFPYNTPTVAYVGYTSKGDVYFFIDKFELQSLSSNLVFLNEDGTSKDKVSIPSPGGCIRNNVCIDSFPLRIIVRDKNPFSQLSIIAKLTMKDKSEYQYIIDRFDKDFNKYFPPLPSINQSEFSEILTIPGGVYPLLYKFRNTDSSSSFTYFSPYNEPTSFFIFSSSYDNLLAEILFEFGNYCAILLFTYGFIVLIYSFLPTKKRLVIKSN